MHRDKYGQVSQEKNGKVNPAQNGCQGGSISLPPFPLKLCLFKGIMDQNGLGAEYTDVR